MSQAPEAASPRRKPSLRRALILLFVGALGYVAAIGLVLFVRIGPATRRLRTESAGLTAEYASGEVRIATVDAIQRDLHARLNAAQAGSKDTAGLEALRTQLQDVEEGSRTLERMASVEGPQAELRALLAMRVSRETMLCNALLGLTASLELHDLDAARRLAAQADELTVRVRAFRSVTTSAALRSVHDREMEIAAMATSAERLAVLWLVLGIAVFPVALVFVRRRLDVPLAALDDGLARVAGGDLSVELASTAPDEVGRLTEHFNRMTSVLRERVVQAAERAELETVARTRAILDAALDAVVVVDSGGIVKEWSPRAESTFGWSREEALGKRVADLIVPAELRAEHTRGLGQFGGHGATPMLGRRVETVAVRRDGTRIPIEVAITPLQRSGHTEFSAFIRDVTEQRQLESQLRQAQKMDAVGQLAGGIAHDFNNLLTGIIGYADLMRNDETATQEQRDDAAAIVSAGERGAELARGLLTLARRSHGRDEAVDLARVAQEAVDLYSRTIDRRIEVVVDLQLKPAPVRGDQSQFANALLNLAINAGDAMPKGGRLTIATRQATLDDAFCTRHSNELQPGEYVALSVRDTGMGMSEEVRMRIFEPFFTTKPVGRGTGLGLAMVYGTARSHRGIVDVESVEGQGTTFTVYIPLDTAGGERDAGQSRDVRAGTGRILVVDDEESVRTVSSRLLQRIGYSVETACDGQEAVDIVRADPQRWDLVVLDGNMPRMTGHDAARLIRELRPDLPLVLATGYFGAYVDHAQLFGVFDGVIAKPFDLEMLSQVVSTHIK